MLKINRVQKRWLNLNIANKPNVEAVKVGNQVIEKTAPMTEEEISQIWSKRQAETRQIPDDEIDFFEWRPSRRLFSASAAMYANPRTDIASFYEFVKNNPHHKKSYMIFKSKNGIALDILSDTLKHDNSEHDLSVDEWTDVLENIDNIEDAKFSAKPTSYGNKSFLLKIKTPKRKYGMAIAYVNGHNYVTTLFKTTDKGYEQWVNKTNKKTAVAPAPYPQAGSSSAQNGNVSYGLSVENIVQLLKSNVNKKDIRNNNKLFSKENNQLPPDAYDAQGKADINTPEFKNWFGDSKVVDEQGKPLVVYHGGKRGIEAFDKSKIRGSGFWGNGFYFSPRKDIADDFAIFSNGVVYPVYLNIKNPFTDRYKFLELAQQGGDVTQKIKDLGYDGVIIGGEYVVFEPNQIKSVYNRGTFSPESNNIYYSNSDEKVYGTYDPSEHLIELFKSARPDTLTHELSQFLSLVRKEIQICFLRYMGTKSRGTLTTT